MKPQNHNLKKSTREESDSGHLSGRSQIHTLSVGVVGHRDLDPNQIPALRKAVGQFFDELRACVADVPLRVLSSLAEGADQLVAEIGLEKGAALMAPLPMNQDDYERTFDTKEGVENLRWLLRRAGETVNLGFPAGLDPAENARQRHLGYTLAGVYVICRAEIVLALWDGKILDKPTGTSKMVEYALQGVPEPVLKEMLRIDPSFSTHGREPLVIQVPCRRVPPEAAVPATETENLIVFEPEQQSAEDGALPLKFPESHLRKWRELAPQGSEFS